MQTINFWHKYHIHCRKIITCLLFLLPALVFSQRNVMENDRKFARKPYHFGIHLGTNLSDFKIQHNALFASSDSILSIKSKYGFGFEIGALASYHINKYLEIRTVPSFVFANKQLTYLFNDGAEPISKDIDQIYFDIPVELKFKSEPLRNMKIYLVAGLKYGYDLGGNLKDRKKPGIPRQSPHDFAVNYGVGFEIHFPLFILSPEFKVSNSILNLHRPDANMDFSKYMKGIYNRSFTFSLNFEG